jgi:hypothetical protein
MWSALNLLTGGSKPNIRGIAAGTGVNVSNCNAPVFEGLY